MDTKKDSVRNKPTLSTYEELTSGFRTSIVETGSGKVFEIHNVDPGELWLVAGSPLIQKFTQAGVNIEESDEVIKHLEDMTAVDVVETVTDTGFLAMMRETVCVGVYSVNFVDKNRKECNPSLQEVPVNCLTVPELFQLSTAIMEISNPEKEVMDFYSFREESEEVRSDSDTSIQSGSEVQSEAVGDLIPEQEESGVDVSDRQPGI